MADWYHQHCFLVLVILLRACFLLVSLVTLASKCLVFLQLDLWKKKKKVKGLTLSCGGLKLLHQTRVIFLHSCVTCYTFFFFFFYKRLAHTGWRYCSCSHTLRSPSLCTWTFYWNKACLGCRSLIYLSPLSKERVFACDETQRGSHKTLRHLFINNRCQNASVHIYSSWLSHRGHS